MELLWGKRIIEAVKQLDDRENTIVLVRHSERPSFEGMPVEQWNSVLLTDRGVDVARQFGRAITTEAAVKSLRVHHWGLKRCAMTADAISEGAVEAGSRVSGPTAIMFKSPILVQKEYQNKVSGLPWNSFVKEWLDSEGPHFGMMSSDQYAREILRSLRNEKLSQRGAATIIATHDLHIIPLVKHVFHVTQPWIDFLDGIALRVNHEEVSVAYAGGIKSLSNESFRTVNE
ncbi:MAG: hypothetical protein JRN20_02830 [Nitrososphaerota archaeon]|jgi:hypothetical protein|nr:hypothetical protein [Nitrososphaerota archaeon]MDG6923852.1 hypothetical protein [Nitrososphaerota archaeon]